MLDEDALRRAAETALHAYVQAHRPGPTRKEHVREVFAGLYRDAAKAGFSGIRWSLTACIRCGSRDDLEPIICFDPRVVAATDGRPVATLLCPDHAHLTAGDRYPQELVAAIVDHLARWPSPRRA